MAEESAPPMEKDCVPTAIETPSGETATVKAPCKARTGCKVRAGKPGTAEAAHTHAAHPRAAHPAYVPPEATHVATETTRVPPAKATHVAAAHATNERESARRVR
jgi:hypothetical protein